MEILSCDSNFSHSKGEFCHRVVTENYFIGCFSTPFLYEVDNQLLEGKPGDLLLMPPGSLIYHGPLSKEEAFVNDWMHLNGEDFRDLLTRYPLPQNEAFNIRNPLLLRDCIEKIKEARILQYEGWEELIDACITETIINIHRFYRHLQTRHTPTHRIESVRNAFLLHPEMNWTLEKMAALCDYSVSRFCSLYMQKYASSPKADLLARRINVAKHLLRYSTLSVTEIAARCGFKSLYYFSRYFKEKEGCSPSEFMK